MTSNLSRILYSLLITSLVLVVLEIVSSAVFPALGLEEYRLSFNILIILFMALKLESPYIALFILVIQFFHGAFSVDGWAMGTIAGVLITIIIGYLKELLHLSTPVLTMLITQVFQTVWFVIVSGLFWLRTGSWDVIQERFFRFLPESIVLSILAPLCFTLLEKIWRHKDASMIRGEY